MRQDLAPARWPGGFPERTTVVWHEGDDAVAVREELRGRLTVDPPVPGRGEALTGGRWDTPDGDPLLFPTWHH